MVTTRMLFPEMASFTSGLSSSGMKEQEAAAGSPEADRAPSQYSLPMKALPSQANIATTSFSSSCVVSVNTPHTVTLTHLFWQLGERISFRKSHTNIREPLEIYPGRSVDPTEVYVRDGAQLFPVQKFLQRLIESLHPELGLLVIAVELPDSQTESHNVAVDLLTSGTTSSIGLH